MIDFKNCLEETLRQCLSVITSHEAHVLNKPKVEFGITILLEGSSNSSRISIAVKKSDETEDLIAKTYSSYIARLAIPLKIIRKKPLKGYDFTFLLTNRDIKLMILEETIKLIVEFIINLEKELNALKLLVNSNARSDSFKWISSF